MKISNISNYIDMYGRAYACMPVYACMYEEGRGERFMHIIKLTRFVRPKEGANVGRSLMDLKQNVLGSIPTLGQRKDYVIETTN